MTRKYDPGLVTHPLHVAQSAALVGGAAGTYRTAIARPRWRAIFLFDYLEALGWCFRVLLAI